MSETQLKKTVNILKLKELGRKLPKDHALRAVLEVEDSEMSVEDFVSKVKTWDRLLRG